MGFVLADGLTELGQEREAERIIFIGPIVDNSILVNVEDSAEQEFGLVDGVGEVGDIGEIAVRHADDIINVEGRLAGNFGATAVVEVLFIGVEVAGGGVRTKARLVGSGVEVAAEEGIIGGREAEALGGRDSFGEEDGLEEGGDVGERKVVGGGEIVGFGDDAAAGLVGAAFEDAAEGASVGKGVEFGRLLI